MGNRKGLKQKPLSLCYPGMTKPANSKNKPSPSDTPTHRPHDDGGKAKLQHEDKTYRADKPRGGDIAKKWENEEQPVHSADKKR